MTLIEAIARAIAEGQGDDFDHAHLNKPHWIETRGESGGRYRDINEPRQPDYIDAAQAALTAITEAGYAVVPIEPTEAMRRAGSESFEDNSCSTHDGYGAIDEGHVHIPWQAMISAAQGDGA